MLKAAMSPQEIEQREAQGLALIDKFCKAADGVEHNVLLQSLLTLYVAVAKTHDCCTASAAKGCALASMQLFTASRTCPQGVSVH